MSRTLECPRANFIQHTKEFGDRKFSGGLQGHGIMVAAARGRGW